MARSTYVYVLTQYGQVFGTYTVKHELVTAALRNIPPHLFSEYKVARHTDGTYGDMPVTMSLKEFVL